MQRSFVPVDSLVIFGELVDITFLGDTLVLLHVDRQLGEKILRGVYGAHEKARAKNASRLSRKVTARINKEIREGFLRLPEDTPDLLGRIISKKESGQWSTIYFEDSDPAHKITVPGVLKELLFTCDACARYAPNQCEHCPFRFCTKLCALAHPYKHYQPCPL